MASVESFLRGRIVAPSSLDESICNWAPDVFCLVASLLQTSGAYVRVLDRWPPVPSFLSAGSERWRERAKKSGDAWREAMNAKAACPAPIVDAFKRLVDAQCSLTELRNDVQLSHLALELLAVADEACVGFGIDEPSEFAAQRAADLLVEGVLTRKGSTLCSERIDSELASVLPKQHTPGVGMTLRSLSHHLALHQGNEVVPFWQGLAKHLERESLNVLVAPWPLDLHRTQFEPKKGTLDEMGERFGFMQFTHRSNPHAAKEWFERLLRSAKAEVGKVHLVVFPECALLEHEFDEVAVEAAKDGIVVVAGVLTPGTPYSKNEVVVRGGSTSVRQSKHHRWKLDRGQIEQYELAGSLNAAVEWWEDSTVGDREVNFVSLRDDLTLACLVCEDLARQDPVASLVRAVGPSLVIAVLMDAPQASRRWPARYATVLSDDPGSSVLSVTSWGMAKNAKPPSGVPKSRAVAMWRDVRSGLVELELPTDAEGLVLSLHTEFRHEISADGRGDAGLAPYPQLSGVVPVKLLRD